MAVGFLFDNDGVLIDSQDLHWQAWTRLMQEEKDLSFTHEQFVAGFGKRNDLILKEIAPNADESTRMRWAMRKEELFRELARGNIQLIPGMEAFLEELKSRKIARIIASSTPPENLRLFLETTPLGRYFDQFISAEEVSRGKPSPEIFVKAAMRLGLEPIDCIVVEDAPAGLKAGKHAHAFVVALATTHSKKELKNYHLLYSDPTQLNLEEILTAAEKWKWSLFNRIPYRAHKYCGRLNRPTRFIVGILLLIFGFIMLFLPVGPGLLMMVVGYFLLRSALVGP